MPGILAAGGGLDPALFNVNPPVAGVRNVRTLDQSLRDVATRVITDDIPPEHQRSHTRLKKILRSTKWLEMASAYDPETEIIRINVPFKWKGNFLRMYKAAADYYYVKWATDKPPADASYWATSPEARGAMQRDNLFEWVIRHEFGHSVDKLIQFTNRFSGHPRFGGWVRYQSHTLLLRDILIDLGMNQLKGSNDLVFDPFFTRFANFLTKRREGSEWRKVDAIRNRREHVKSVLWESDTEMHRKLREAHRLVHYAIDDPWLVGNRTRYTVAGGRRYLFNSDYEEWYSCSDSAFQSRISNYQFSSPSEWFAETYAAWRGFGTAFRNLLIPSQGLNPNQDVVDWFNENLVRFEGICEEDLLENEDTPEAALRPAILPDHPNEDDLEVNVPGTWHFKPGPNLQVGGNPFNQQAVAMPN